MNQVVIEPLPVSSWQEYKEIRLNALKTEPQAFMDNYAKSAAYPDEKWQQRLEKFGKGESWTYFARNQRGKVIGMLGAYRNPEPEKNNKVEIFGVYVEPSERGLGTGKQLMNFMLDVLKKVDDIKTVEIEVNVDNEPAKNLYLKLGFFPVKTQKYVLGDGLEHEVLLLRKDNGV